MSLFKNFTLYKLVDYILPFFFVLSFIEFYFGLWRLTTIIKFVSILITLLISLKSYNVNKCFFKYFFTLFIIFNLLTIVAYIFNDRPIDCYLNDFFNYVPAMLYVYVGMTDNRNDKSYFNKFLIYCSLSMVIGIFLYFLTPGWYLQRQVEIINSSWFADTTYSEENVMNAVRFTSYLASEYAVSFFSIFGLSISLFNYYNTSNKNSARNILFISIMFLAAILSQMRVAISISVLILFFYLFRGLLYGKSKKSIYILVIFSIMFICLFVVILTNFRERTEQVIDLVFGRLEELSFSKALQGRDFQIRTLMSDWEYPLFGHGMGSGGSIARSYGFNAVTDANYIKILFETGIFGSLFFISIVIMTLIRGARHLIHYLTEMIIICFILISMLGANSLTLSYLYIMPFWYAIGKIWNNNYYNMQIIKSNK
jgi:hypothetical protein